MEQQDFGTSWRNIDQPGDPGYFVRFMDVINSIQWFRDHKRTAIGMLGIGEGHRVLEVGCGTGEEARHMAQLVGRSGRLVATDISETMVHEARKRAKGLDLPIEFRVADAHALDFDDNTFDACGSFSAFEILQDPRQALAEMVRVTRPGGWVVVPGPDTGTCAVNSPDRDLTRRILDHFCDNVVNGWIGRQLPGMYKAFGLTDVTIVPSTLILTDYALVHELWLRSIAANAREAGVVSAGEAADWLDGLEKAGQTEGFFFSSTAFIVSGRKA